jgi:ABC-2 type transport system permease protein
VRTVRFLVRKEFRQIFRDRATLVQMLVIPFAQLVLLSFAATFEITRTRMHVVDLDRTRPSRELVSRFTATGRFDVVGYSASMERADEQLLGREASLVLRIPHGFERALVRQGAAPVQLVLNAEEGAAAGVVRSYATRVIADHAAALGAELRPELRRVRAPGAAPPAPGAPRVEVRTRGWYNAEMDYKAYMVPGILVSLVTLIGTLLTAQNIAREKELGTLEQINVTPITRGQFIAGKLIPFWIMALLELSVGLALAKLLFDIPMRGSLLLVLGTAAVYLVGALGVGLWISTLVETQQQAMFVTFFILVVYFLLGGIYTPIDSMPAPVQWLAELNPIKHFVVIMRAVLMKGAGLGDVVRPLLSLVAFAAAVFALAVRQYSKTSA